MPSFRVPRGSPAEARRTRRKEFLIKKYSELCELCASAEKRDPESHRGGAENAEGKS